MKSELRPSSGAARVAPHRLQHPHRGRAHGHHPPALGQRAVDRLGGGRLHPVGLGVDGVLVQLVDGHRPEGVQADAQRHRDDLVAAAELGPQSVVEVQAGGRRGGRAGVAGVHGLVAAGVVGLAVDVGRKRHLAHVLERVLQRPGDERRHPHPALPQPLVDPKAGLAGGHRLALAQAGVRAGQRLPGAVAQRLQQQQLDRAAGGPAGVHAGRQHARVVDHDQVVGRQLAQQVGEAAVADRAGRPLVDQQPGRRARLGRGLGDQGLGKNVVKVGGAHSLEYGCGRTAHTWSRCSR